MSRSLAEIITHIRAVAANPSVSTTLIQTEDLELLCSAAEALPMDACRLHSIVSRYSSPTKGQGDVHGGQRGIIIYEDQWPFIHYAINEAIAQERPPARCKFCGNPRPEPNHNCPARPGAC